MTEIERDILESLVALETAVRTMSTAHLKPDLQSLFARLDELTRRLPSGTDERLQHYLRKKSYEKARLFLEGRDAANARGACLGD